MPATRRDLQAWSHELAENQLPVFARTARTVLHEANASEGSATELAKQILQDASMTTRLLRMANSIYFNPGGQKITTVSRAIILLGFNVVRDMCLSISVIDTFLKGPDRALVAREMAHSFHAALQAKRLAELSRQKEPEEIFIATLLYHLGELAFLCYAGRIDDEVVGRLLTSRRTRAAEVAEREVLGFALRDLTMALNREWRLSTLLAATLDPNAPPSKRSETVGLGHEIATALLDGPSSPAMRDVLRKVERTLGIPADVARGQILQSARAAAETIGVLGAPDASVLVPVASESAAPVDAAVGADAAATPPAATAAAAADAAATSAPAPAAPQVPPHHEADPALQLDVLRELSQLLVESKPDVNVLMEMVLEGIFRGVGMDRAVFALLTPDKTLLRAKAVLSLVADDTQARFVFPLNQGDVNPFPATLRSGEPLWLGDPRHADINKRVDTTLQNLCGGHCFLMPLAIGATPIGCLYADRARSKRPLREDLFTQFKLFGQQARMGLAFIKGR